MKTERRHELQTNKLASSLANWIEAVQPYSRAILAVGVALCVLGGAWFYLSTQSSRRSAEGWTEYFTASGARDPRDSLSDVAERYNGTMVGEWASISLADYELDDGTNKLFLSKADARDELGNAIRRYQTIIHDSKQPLLQQRATFGLARAHEALGELTKARDEYRSVAKEWPDSAYQKESEARADALDKLSAKEFYDWFAKYERPQARFGPGAADPALQNMLEQSGLQMPKLNEKSLLPSGAEPAGETPAEPGSVTPPAEPGAGDKPADAPAATPESAPPSDSPAKPTEPATPAPAEPK